MKKTGNVVTVLLIDALVAFALTGEWKNAALVFGAVVLSVLLTLLVFRPLSKKLSGCAACTAQVMLLSGFLAVCAMVIATFFPGAFAVNDKVVVCVILVSGATGICFLRNGRIYTVSTFSGTVNTLTVPVVAATAVGTAAVSAVKILLVEGAGAGWLALPAYVLTGLAAAGVTSLLFKKADAKEEGHVSTLLLLCVPFVCAAAGFTEAGTNVLLGLVKGVANGCILSVSITLIGGVCCRVEQFSLPSFMKGYVFPYAAAGILSMVYAAF